MKQPEAPTKKDPDMILPPYDEAQIESFNYYQKGGAFHPYTCTNNHKLVIAEEGLLCLSCDYTQDFAWRWTLDWSWVDQIDVHRRLTEMIDA